MKITEFLPPTAEACSRKGPHDRIVLSSRVRLARNLQGRSFPCWARKTDRVETMEMVRTHVQALEVFEGGFTETMDKLKAVEKQLLVERHLISREHAAKSSGSALVLSRDESFCVMINEEDHMRMQALKPGLQIKEAWQAINDIDSELESHLEYAFSEEFGYLTACPTNVGTAIRVSAMLHLPGLALAEQISPIVNSVNKLGLAVRGLYGEGTDALGHIFQVSNQMTLGENEPEIVERLSKVLFQLIENEKNAREKLLEEKPKVVFNHIGRAYGILANAHTISSKETMNLLSLLRLGIELDVFPDLDSPAADELFILTQPAHLQHERKGKLNADQRDITRADLLRERLRNVSRPNPSVN